jgi:hypothetical protein
MWVEEVSARERIRHCSHAQADPPEFAALVFKIVIRSP